MKGITLLWIDPGIAHTGLAVVRGNSSYKLIDSQLVKTPSKDETGKRLDTIHEALTQLLDKHAPVAIAIEACYHNKNVSSAASTQKVIGLCELTAYTYEIPVMTFTPQQIKAASGFGGSANKDEMVKIASRIFKTQIKSHHTADAALCALAGILQHHIPQLEGREPQEYRPRLRYNRESPDSTAERQPRQVRTP